MKSVVSEKGQVTIPKALRDSLGIRAGQVLDFAEVDGQLVAVKRSERSGVDEVYGVLALGCSTDDLIAELRGPIDAT